MKYSLLTFFLLFGTALFCQQAGQLDTTFNYEVYSKFHNGKQFLLSSANSVTFVLESNFGGVYSGGEVAAYNGISGQSVFKFDSLGVIDTSFHCDLTLGRVYSAAEQSDGKVVLVGKYLTFDNNSYHRIVRINPDGSQDLTFNVGSGAQNNDGSAEIYDVHVDANGKILIAGEFYTFSGVNRKGIARLNSNGSVDYSFNPGSGFHVTDATGVSCMEVQSDGKILVGGWFTHFNGSSQNGFIRLNTNGSKDITMTGGGISGWEPEVRAIQQQADGKILVGGKFSSVNGSVSGGFARLFPNGNPDVQFNQNVVAQGGLGIMSIIELQSDQKIILWAGGSYGAQSVDGLIRIDSSAFLDTTFRFNHDLGLVYTVNVSITDVHVRPNNELIVAGDFTKIQGYRKFGIVKLHDNGNVDTEFARSTGPCSISDGSNLYGVSYVNCFEKDALGRIYIGGLFTEYNGELISGVARIFQSGELDTTFNVSMPNVGKVLDMKIQDDGKIVVVGDFGIVNNDTVRGIARLNVDGSTDSTFQVSEGVDGNYDFVSTVDIQPWDGKILFSGPFDYFEGMPTNRIMRLHSDGTIDPSFSVSSGSWASKIEVLPSTRILVSGDVCSNGVSRLFNNGACDNSFSTVGSTPNGDHIIEPDGRILIGLNNRLFPNGMTDNPLNVNVSFSGGYAYHKAVQPDGMIILAGDFDAVNGVQRNGLARVFPDGTLDNSFDPGLGFDVSSNVAVYSLFHDDSMLYIGGSFDTYLGGFQNNLIRIHAPLYVEPLDIDVVFAKDVSCSSPGEISVTGIHGTPPYSYEWSNTSPLLTDSTINCFSGGVYTCVVTDASGEVDSVSVLISEAVTDQSDLRVTVSASHYDDLGKLWMVINGMNDGCTPKNGFIRLIYEGNRVNVASMPNLGASAWYGDTIIWNFSDISWDSPRVLKNLVFEGGPFPLSEPLKFEVYIDSTGNDWNTENNHYNFEVKGTNDQLWIENAIKTSFPTGRCDENFIQANEPFHYSLLTRNFNENGYTASNIRLHDTLDQSIDLNKVRVIASNDNVWTEVRNGNVLTFHLDSCNLQAPPYNFPNMFVNQYRMVTFEIAGTEMNQGHGYILENQFTAEFDRGFSSNFWNTSTPVVNQVFSDGVLVHYDCENPNLSIDETLDFGEDKLIIFPNPTSGFIEVLNTDEDLRYVIFDILGGVVQEGVTNEPIFLNEKKGVYLMKVYRSDSSIESFRVILQ